MSSLAALICPYARRKEQPSGPCAKRKEQYFTCIKDYHAFIRDINEHDTFGFPHLEIRVLGLSDSLAENHLRQRAWWPAALWRGCALAA